MKIANNYKSGISVFGYYRDGLNQVFTCINQGIETPQSHFELDFVLPEAEAYSLIRNGRKACVFVPIESPKK